MKLKGFDEFERKLMDLAKLDAVKICLAGGWYALGKANEDGVVPVDTGYMRANSDVIPYQDKGAEINYYADYAFYVEQNQPWLRPTLDSERNGIGQVMANEAKKQIEAKI